MHAGFHRGYTEIAGNVPTVVEAAPQAEAPVPEEAVPQTTTTNADPDPEPDVVFDSPPSATPNAAQPHFWRVNEIDPRLQNMTWNEAVAQGLVQTQVYPDSDVPMTGGTLREAPIPEDQIEEAPIRTPPWMYE